MDRLAGLREAASRDEALVRRAQSGDPAAFDVLLAGRLDRCYRLAWAILGNAADAADATQDGFVAAWRQLPRLRDPAAFDGWLNRIVANAARQARRHRHRLREIPMEPAEELAAGLASASNSDRPGHARSEADTVAENEAIGRAFDRLAAEQRLLLVLHHLEDRPLAEIARSLGMPVGTVKWRLHGARKALERAMEAER